MGHEGPRAAHAPAALGRPIKVTRWTAGPARSWGPLGSQWEAMCLQMDTIMQARQHHQRVQHPALTGAMQTQVLAPMDRREGKQEDCHASLWVGQMTFPHPGRAAEHRVREGYVPRFWHSYAACCSCTLKSVMLHMRRLRGPMQGHARACCGMAAEWLQGASTGPQ